MGLWQQMKTGKCTPTNESMPAKALGDKARGDAGGTSQTAMVAGEELINRAVSRIADLWSEVQGAGGSIAWEWILRGSDHGARILRAEDHVNAVARRGDRAALASACDAWVSAWRSGIEGWKASQREFASTRSIPFP